ncbi:SRPBCC domain-containing protein [Georgenia sp. M64]|uniref:SRPBCC family protein n=1 Tax=Georgenia sp. M64 TaxID=3120520 RepID=UPI0030DE77D8
MTSQHTTTVDEEARTITVERTFAADAERLWQAWTDPALVARWYGPHHWTTTVHEMDVRPGGRWRYTMAPDDGSRPPMNGVATYEDVEPPHRLTYLDRIADDAWTAAVGEPGLSVAVTFEPTPEGTRVRVVAGFGDDEGLRRGIASGMSGGYVETLDRLASVVLPGHGPE